MFGHEVGGSVVGAGGLDAGSLTPGWAPPDPDDPWSGWWGEPAGEASLPGGATSAGELATARAGTDALGDTDATAGVDAAAGVDGLGGVGLARVLGGVEVAECSAAGLVEVIAGWERVVSWARAAQAGAVTALTRCAEMRPDDSAGSAGRMFGSLSAITIAAAEIAAALPLTSRQAENLVGEAVRLVEDFPLTHTALTAGRLDPRRVKVITDELGAQEPAVRRAVEGDVLATPTEAPDLAAPDAPDLAASGVDVSELDSTMLRRRVRVAVHELAPATTVQRHAQARAGRFVRVSPAADGMAWLEALLPAEDATAVKQAIDAAAATLKRRDRDAGDAGARTADQRRADAFAAMAWSSLETGRLGACRCGHHRQCQTRHGISLGGTRGRRAAVEVTVSLTTLAGLDDAPGELAGYGPIPARLARELSAAGVWRWIRRDPGSGALLDLGRTRYTPTTGLAEFIIARDRECVMPGCHRAARASQLDHTVAFPHGPTAASNLGPLCQAHHLVKHRSRWRVDQPQPGVFVWTSPTGRVHTVRPDDPCRTRTGAHTIDFDKLDTLGALDNGSALSGDGGGDAADDPGALSGSGAVDAELGAADQPQPSPDTPADTADTIETAETRAHDHPLAWQGRHPPPGDDPPF